MAEKLAVVYTARNKQQAHILRNALEEAGIEAVVTGDVVSDGSGVDAVGWATAAQVVVAQEDAARARALAEQFDRQGVASAPATGPEVAEEAAFDLAEWPTCPECGARRTATCPVCHTSGVDFPQADAEFVGSLEPDADATPMSCGCGSRGCSSTAPKEEDTAAAGVDAADDSTAADAEVDESQPAAPRLVLTCTMCDEPFAPQFLRRCEWCGHEFPDGCELEEVASDAPEEITGRALVVMIGLGLAAIALIAYFLFLVPAK